MGNKQGKPATTAATVQAAARFKRSSRGDAASSAETATQPPPSTENAKEPEPVLSSDSIPTEEAPLDTNKPEPDAAEKTEDEKQTASEKPPVTMPALDLENIDRNPLPEEQKADLDLMAPPVFLTDAMSTLKDTDQQLRPKQPSLNEAVLIASPITECEVCLEAPEPASTPIEVPPERDDVSIDEEVSAAGEDVPTEPKESASEDIVLSAFGRVPGHIPEDAASLTSSVARGEDELLKNIMGTSVAFPALTSNESVRGSVAVSEYYVDESHWETMRSTGSAEKALPEMPQLVFLDLHPVEDSVTVVLGYTATMTTKEDQGLQEAVAPEVAAESEVKVEDGPVSENAMKNVVTSIFAGVVQQSVDEDVQETEAKKVSLDFTEVDDGTLKMHLAANDSTKRVESYPSEVSSKQLSVELNTPFVHCYAADDSMHSTEEPTETAAKTTEVTAVETKEEAVEVTAVETKEEAIEDSHVEPERLETQTQPVDEPIQTTVEPTKAVVVEVTEPTTEETDPKEAVESKTEENAQPHVNSLPTDERTEVVVEETKTAAEVTEAITTEPKTEEVDPPVDATDPPADEANPTEQESKTLESVPSGDIKKPRKSKSKKKKKKTGEKTSSSPGAKPAVTDRTGSVKRSLSSSGPKE